MPIRIASQIRMSALELRSGKSYVCPGCGTAEHVTSAPSHAQVLSHEHRHRIQAGPIGRPMEARWQDGLHPYTCACVSIYAYVHIHIYAHPITYYSMKIHIHMFIFIHTHVCICIYAHIYLHIRMYSCMCTRACPHRCSHMWTRSPLKGSCNKIQRQRQKNPDALEIAGPDDMCARSCNEFQRQRGRNAKCNGKRNIF
jgi:hypothetical protein